MRWGLVATALLSISVQASPTSGPAPLHVTFNAAGATSAHWDFGDGAAADGLGVEHTYAAGRWNATVTAQAADGTTSTQTVPVTAYGLSLKGPAAAPTTGERCSAARSYPPNPG
jgi:PKD repeat protein